jgi:hypothetical protein
VLGITGEFASGKTLFALTVDPATFAEDQSKPPTTLHWDTEGSATSYVDGLHFEHRNLADAMLEKHPKGHKPIQLFEHWRDKMRAVEPGQYRVLALDTVSEIEDGLGDWVRKHPEEFGHTSGQYDKMEGLFWGDVKAYWKRLLSEVMARCECFVFTSHMRAVWRGKQPVPGARQPKGKETLMELASLYLQLDRTPKPGAKEAPRKPSAAVLKSRLAHFDRKAGEMMPILPPRLAEATPDAIREYIAKPPDYSKLEVGERARPQELSEDEKLAFHAGIAENEATKAQAELSKVELMKQAATAQAQAGASPLQQAAPAQPKRGDYSASDNGQCTPEQQQRIKGLFQKLGTTADQARKVIAKRGVEKLADLTQGQAAELIGRLETKAAEGGAPF